MKKKKLIIMGGGFAGLRSFYHLKEYDKFFDITLIDKRAKSLEKPALPEVAFAGNHVEHTLIDLKSVIHNHGGSNFGAKAVRQASTTSTTTPTTRLYDMNKKKSAMVESLYFVDIL